MAAYFDIRGTIGAGKKHLFSQLLKLYPETSTIQVNNQDFGLHLSEIDLVLVTSEINLDPREAQDSLQEVEKTFNRIALNSIEVSDQWERFAGTRDWRYCFLNTTIAQCIENHMKVVQKEFYQGGLIVKFYDLQAYRETLHRKGRSVVDLAFPDTVGSLLREVGNAS